MKIGIFTCRPVNPLHPRLEAFANYFKSKNIQYEFIPPVKHPVFSRINWLSLFFFDNLSVLRNRKKPSEYDLILVNDLKYLPIARFAKRFSKTVIYDTIDHNVSLRAYSLGKKIPLPGFMKKGIIKYFTRKERKLAADFCDTVIVNSEALKEYFNNRAETLYYYSPFESLPEKNKISNPPALIYLGEFSAEKGAGEVLEIREKMNIELFIYGTVYSDQFRNKLNHPMIHFTGKIAQEELALRLSDHLKKYFLIGFSLIRPAHLSYEIQEANKDIDYLALGIPIIGNHRLPTGEKINSGCGIFSDDASGLIKLISDPDFRIQLSSNCREYYNARYAKRSFTVTIDNIFSKYLQL